MIEEKTEVPNVAADEGCLKFLRALARWQGVATPQEIGPQTSQDENRVRQKCKRRGWATYGDGYWRLTHAGRTVLRTPPPQAQPP